MVEYVLMGAMAAVIVSMLALRTNTAICFLAVCAGSVLLASSGDNLSLIATSVTSGISTSTNVMRIVLLTAPLAVCMVLLRKHMPAALLPMAIVPAVCGVMLGTIYAVPLLSEGTFGAIAATDTWQLLIQYQEPIVGLGLVVSIVLLALTIKKPHDKHHKKGKH